MKPSQAETNRPRQIRGGAAVALACCATPQHAREKAAGTREAVDSVQRLTLLPRLFREMGSQESTSALTSALGASPWLAPPSPCSLPHCPHAHSHSPPVPPPHYLAFPPILITPRHLPNRLPTRHYHTLLRQHSRLHLPSTVPFLQPPPPLVSSSPILPLHLPVLPLAP